MAYHPLDNQTESDQLNLKQLLDMAKRSIEQSFPQPYWVVAEITEVRIAARGYCYLTLIHKEKEAIVAKISAVLWRSSTVLQRFRLITGRDLASGMTALFSAKLSFHPQYGMQLEINDIDPNFTLGDLERQKRETIERLTREKLIDRNKALHFPLVPQRVAVISSATAAGYEDFVHQLHGNPYEFGFKHTLFSATMQGQNAEPEVLTALNKIASQASRFDVVVIIRGGGASVDLTCFDSYAIGAAIARLPLPVITGIGHERNDTIVDLCGHTRVKTPTAAAEKIISTVKLFAERVDYVAETVFQGSVSRIEFEKNRLESVSQRLSSKASALAATHENRINRSEQSIKSLATRILEANMAKMTNLETAVRLLDPANVLQRGYSITYINGKSVTSAAGIANGDTLTTRLFEGNVTSTVTAKETA